MHADADGFSVGKDLVNTTSSTLTTILDTVAPPISEHETLELWLSHPMIGYAGVEGVIYRAWARILEQTESGELIIVWSPSPTPGDSSGEPRGINPVEGWDAAWELGKKEIAAIKAREEEKPRGRAEAKRNMPVTTVPIFLHLQPLLVRLPYAEPPIHSSTSIQDKPFTPPNHLYFLFTLEDPTHSLTFTTVSQPTPSDWMDVEYENSEWVEERLVEVLRTGVEVIAQDVSSSNTDLELVIDLLGSMLPLECDSSLPPLKLLLWPRWWSRLIKRGKTKLQRMRRRAIKKHAMYSIRGRGQSSDFSKVREHPDTYDEDNEIHIVVYVAPE